MHCPDLQEPHLVWSIRQCRGPGHYGPSEGLVTRLHKGVAPHR
jgi:hypothetical protein